DKVVPLVVIGGKIAWHDDDFSEQLGRVKMGRLLKPRSYHQQSAA
ncbi:MAG: hypothetical protein HKN85_02545, partial [Gammaproteobacteria bacterium]|nr:hypothetical protein [Gammaproteobacteria bacterium]